jgi:hypothetical protein
VAQVIHREHEDKRNRLGCHSSSSQYVPNASFSLEHFHLKLSGNALSLGADAMRDLVMNAARNNVSQTLDIKCIIWMAHINLVVDSKESAHFFYVDFFGLTADANKSFHVNIGQQQLVENGNPPKRIASSIGLVVPSLETLGQRVAGARKGLAGTQFLILAYDVDAGYMTLILSLGRSDAPVFRKGRLPRVFFP